MTVIRSSHSLRNVLDFSGTQYSKNQIRKALRALEIQTIETDQDGNRYYIHNQIKVGMYIIQIVTNPQGGLLKLKSLDVLLISIYEAKGKLPLQLDQDGRFKRQYWVEHNIQSTFKVKHLVDTVAHCQRLDGLKAFL
jgi:hypothetical protein